MEHLYWGKQLQSGFDMRYLSQSSRMSHFDTSELFDAKAYTDKIIKDETSFEIIDLWRPVEKSKNLNELDYFEKVRQQNLLWRMKSIKMIKNQAGKKEDLKIELELELEKKSMNHPFLIPLKEDYLSGRSSSDYIDRGIYNINQNFNDIMKKYTFKIKIYKICQRVQPVELVVVELGVLLRPKG